MQNAHFDDLSDLKVVGVLSKHDSFRQKIIPYRSFLEVFNVKHGRTRRTERRDEFYLWDIPWDRSACK